MRNAALVSLITLALGHFVHSQSWSKTEKVDPLRGTQIVRYTLTGKFLTPPSHAHADSFPTIIAECTRGSFAHGTAHGKLLKGYIFVGATLDSDVARDLSSRVEVHYRLDDGKIQNDRWSVSKDFSALFYNPYCEFCDFANILYAHQMPHKENTSPPVRKFVIEVPEYLGGAVVMQFDMPADPTEVGDDCGVIEHKRGK